MTHGVPGAKHIPKSLSITTGVENSAHAHGVILYEALMELADDQNRVLHHIKDIAKSDPKLRQVSLNTKGELSGAKLARNLQYLKAIGAVKQHGNRVKILVKHPDELDDGVRSSMPVKSNGHSSPMGKALARVPKATVDLMDSIDSVPAEVLADSIARKMWERYEWALSELGKMHAALESKDAMLRAKDDELHRLQIQLEGRQPVDTKDAARLILS